MSNYFVIVNSPYSLPFDIRLLKTNKTTYYWLKFGSKYLQNLSGGVLSQLKEKVQHQYC